MSTSKLPELDLCTPLCSYQEITTETYVYQNPMLAILIEMAVRHFNFTSNKTDLKVEEEHTLIGLEASFISDKSLSDGIGRGIKCLTAVV